MVICLKLSLHVESVFSAHVLVVFVLRMQPISFALNLFSESIKILHGSWRPLLTGRGSRDSATLCSDCTTVCDSVARRASARLAKHNALGVKGQSLSAAVICVDKFFLSVVGLVRLPGARNVIDASRSVYPVST